MVPSKGTGNITPISQSKNHTGIKLASTGCGDSRSGQAYSVAASSRKTAKTPLNGLISIKAAKNQLGGKRKDSRSSLHAISISVDQPSRDGGSRCGSSIAPRSVAASSIIGILSERLRTRDLKQHSRQQRQPQTIEPDEIIYTTRYNNLHAAENRPKTQIKAANIKTELNEKRKIVENIIAKDRAKINQTVMENYTNKMFHEMPTTKHSNYLAMTNGGNSSPEPRNHSNEKRNKAGNQIGSLSSPFDSLKYY